MQSSPSNGADLISREDVVREIVEWSQIATDNEIDMAIKEFLSFLKERIDTLPSAENSNTKTQNSNQETQKSNGETIKWLESLKAEIGKSEHRPLWHYAEAIDTVIESLSAEAKTKCIAQIKVDTEEIVRRIKEEYDITEDAVKVVRCKDCKNRAKHVVCHFLGEDGFCSYGERREDGEL